MLIMQMSGLASAARSDSPSPAPIWSWRTGDLGWPAIVPQSHARQGAWRQAPLPSLPQRWLCFFFFERNRVKFIGYTIAHCGPQSRGARRCSSPWRRLRGRQSWRLAWGAVRSPSGWGCGRGGLALSGRESEPQPLDLAAECPWGFSLFISPPLVRN